MSFKKNICFSLCILYLFASFAPTFAQARLENFRATNQRVALVDWNNEFVEPSVNENLLKDTRRIINRYSKTYDRSALQEFNLLENPDNQYFRPVSGEMGEAQKEFLQKSGKDNQVDIFVLGNLREAPTGFDLELQLYDIRIDTLSAVESSKFRLAERQFALQALLYRVFNYLDRDGFVHPSPQDFLEKPALIRQDTGGTGLAGVKNDSFIAPEELSTGKLAGATSIGGEKTPFWERWWFWTLIFGSLATAGGLSYYFLVVNQPTDQAEVTFQMPN